MRPKTNLYCLAIIPPEELIHHITTLKLEVARTFNCKEALKNIPMITLQSPFQQLPYREEIIIEKLKRFAHQQHPLQVYINGFGAFAENAIYLKVRNGAPLKAVQKGLGQYLVDQLFFSEEMITKYFLPHIPVAYKDIKRKFRKMHDHYKNKRFQAEFTASNMHLLKYDINCWEVIASFDFLGVGYTMDLFKNYPVQHQRQLVATA